jgi:hypothetical protein
MRWVVIGALAGLPIAAVLSWIFDWTSAGVVRTSSAPAGGTATAVGLRAPLLLAALAACIAAGAGGAILVWRHAAPAPVAPLPSESVPDPLEGALREVLRNFHADAEAPPIWFRQRIRRHVDRLLADPRTRTVIYPRMKQWWPLLARKLAEHGVTEELGYVAWVESGFDPAARPRCRSRRGAVELLQRDCAPIRPARGWRAGRPPRSHSLTSLAQRPGGLRLQTLPEETMEYVPKVLAVAIISHDPGRFGLE